MTQNVWVKNPSFTPGANFRLFCFPYGGGGASVYHSWAQRLPKTIDVCPIQMPGRENRLKEKLYHHVAPLIPTIAEAIEPLLNKPFAFFGHSLGAVVCFELARYLRGITGKTPIHLFVSGHPAPQLPRTRPDLHTLPEEEFKKAIRELNGTPQEVWEYPELVDMVLPILRADFTMYETYTYSQDEPFHCPITAFGGKDDSMAYPYEIEAWGEQTTAPFTSHFFSGDHFFIQPNQSEVQQIIAHSLYPQAIALVSTDQYLRT